MSVQSTEDAALPSGTRGQARPRLRRARSETKGRDLGAYHLGAVRIPSLGVSVARWFRERGIVYYRAARVVRCDDLETGDDAPNSEPSVEEACEEDLRALASPVDGALPEWLARVARGAVCLVARSHAERLGYVWITRKAHPITEVGYLLDVSREPSTVYLFDGYVLPEHRRQGALRALLTACKRWAKRNGVSRLYAAFARDNAISEHTLRRAGFVTAVADVVLLRVLTWEWKRVRAPEGVLPITIVPGPTLDPARRNPHGEPERPSPEERIDREGRPFPTDGNRGSVNRTIQMVDPGPSGRRRADP